MQVVQVFKISRLFFLLAHFSCLPIASCRRIKIGFIIMRCKTMCLFFYAKSNGGWGNQVYPLAIVERVSDNGLVRVNYFILVVIDIKDMVRWFLMFMRLSNSLLLSSSRVSFFKLFTLFISYLLTRNCASFSIYQLYSYHFI